MEGSKHLFTKFLVWVQSKDLAYRLFQRYLVEEHGLSLSDRDIFGSQALHWAVLHGHLETVKWICERTKFGGARADWWGAFQKMQDIKLIRPEHAGALRTWRMRGLQKSARSLTPLGVAVLHNHEEIAKYLMGYGTEDSTCIEMKRSHLFNEDNRDLHLVAKTWPELLPGVLNGFERAEKRNKHSWDTEDRQVVAPTGWSERTYDIKLLYGVPEVSTSRSPLSILLATECSLLFEIKVVQMVVALKWSVFGHRYYVWELGRYFALSACFILGFIVWGEAVNWTGTTSFDQQDHYMEVVGGSLARILCWALTLYNLLVEEGREFKAAKSARKYLKAGWNLQSILAYVLVLALIAVYRPWTMEVKWETDAGYYTAESLARRMVTAPAALLLFMRFMEHLAVWRSTGIFIAVIRMILAESVPWAVLFILFELAFSLAFFSLLRGNSGFETVGESIVTVFVMCMGEIDIPFSENGHLHTMAVLLFVTFMLLVAIVYLNLLVAMMTAEYDKVVKGATAEAMINRAAALVKWEGIMPEKTRVKGATAVEPEQTSIKRPVDSHSAVMKELAEIRETMAHLAKRSLARLPPGDSFSSSDQDLSFRRRQAGMLDAHGNGLSDLRLSATKSTKRLRSVGSVTSEDLKGWKEKAREVEQQANSRRGIIRAQALIRGYLQRSSTGRAKFLSDITDVR